MHNKYLSGLLTALLIIGITGTRFSWARGESDAKPAHDFGLGIILGDPTGGTGKLYLSDVRAIQFGAAFSFGNFFLVYADYLFHFPGGFGNAHPFVTELSPYIGVGGVLFLASASPAANRRYFGNNVGSTGLGLRIPLGIEWLPTNVPIGVFVEIAPGVGLVPNTFGFFEGGVGIRYYF